VLRDTLDDRRRARVLSLLNGITCIIPVLAPVLGHLIMLKYPWQSLFYTMTGMGVMVGLLSVFMLRETRPTAPAQTAGQNHAMESLLNRFFLSRIVITTLSVTAILTYVNVSPVLMMEEMGFDRGHYSMAMALMALVSMAVSFSTPFALTLFKPRTLMLTSQVLFLAAGFAEPCHQPDGNHARSGADLRRLLGGLWRRMSQALGPFTLRAGVASSVLGIAQVCGSSLWIWLAIIGLSAMNMLIGILIACSIVSLVLILVAPARVAQHNEEALSSLDLNLLLCLQLLTQELSVTRTAKRMNVSPSAVSKSLAKLRAWFDDPLFVKTPLGLSPTPLMSSMEQDLADWMQMGNQILDKPHHTMPSGLKFELAAETPLLMILFNTLSQRIYQRYPQALIRLRNWDYDSLDAIIRGEVDIGFCGRETHPRSREQLSLLPWYIDFEVLFTDLPQVWLRADHPALTKSGIWRPFYAIRISISAGNKAIPGRWTMFCTSWGINAPWR
jgi:DNA-binding transcriptional LysR family regulator